jgi:hypothetical protein
MLLTRRLDRAGWDRQRAPGSASRSALARGLSASLSGHGAGRARGAAAAFDPGLQVLGVLQVLQVQEDYSQYSILRLPLSVAHWAGH